MTASAQVGLFIAGLVTAATAHAAFEELPEITVQSGTRTIEVTVIADQSSFPPRGASSTDAGSFSESVVDAVSGEDGSEAFADASQDTTISRFAIRGSGSTEGIVSSAPTQAGNASCIGSSIISVTFTVGKDSAVFLTGMLDSSNSSSGQGQFGAMTELTIFGTDINDQFFLYTENSRTVEADGEVPVAYIGSVKKDTLMVLTISASAIPIGFTGGAGSARAFFEFNLDFGDRDGDGLLDTWEKDGGIDVDGIPGFEVDLLEADPDVKDIFVEIDIMGGNTPFDLPVFATAIAEVQYAFAQAPALLVDNPNGEAGIQLHLVWDDGDRPITPAMDGHLTGSGWPTQFALIKQTNFGSSDDRSDPTIWPEIRKARLASYRYCLWSDSLFRGGRQISGTAELPGNDFIVAAGNVKRWWSIVETEALAGTLMHELGHTLALWHGGAGAGAKLCDNGDLPTNSCGPCADGSKPQQCLTFKPNFLSVMSYTYQTPRVGSLVPQRVRDGWFLDYSRSALFTLRETELVETALINGPPGRHIIFNIAPDMSPGRPAVARADALNFDWNNVGGLDQNPVVQDISRIRSDQSAASLERHVSYTDWDNLWYHLSGTADFADGIHGTNEAIQDNFDLEAVEALDSTDWVDHTILDDEIFSHGFESGDTSGWNDTVP